MFLSFKNNEIERFAHIQSTANVLDKEMCSDYSYLHYCVENSYMPIENLPFPSLSVSSVAAAYRLRFCCILRRISSSIWSQIVVGFDSSRWWSCILNSTWTSATQHTIDSSNPDIPHKLPRDILLFVSEMRFSWFIVSPVAKNSAQKPCSCFLRCFSTGQITCALPLFWSVQCTVLLNWWDYCTRLLKRIMSKTLIKYQKRKTVLSAFDSFD